MDFISAKCTNCGGEIQLDDSKEYGFCMHCGSKVIVQEAVQRLKLELSGPIIVESNIDSMLKSAEGFIGLKSWDDAERLFQKIVELDSTDYRAWWGLTRVYSREFTNFTDTRHIRCYENAIKMSDPANDMKMDSIYRAYRQKSEAYCDIAKKYPYSAEKGMIYYDPVSSTFNIVQSSKNRTLALILCILIGFYGIHRFYVGKIGTGLVWMFTAGAWLIGWIVDIVVICKGTFSDGDGKIISKW